MTLLARPDRTAVAASKTIAVTFYTRADCPCTRKALDVLEQARDRFPSLAIEAVDIASDPALAEAYGATAPIVLIGGKVRFRGLVNPALLDRLLAAEAR